MTTGVVHRTTVTTTTVTATQQLQYRPRPSERFILSVLYDVFIAPVYAAFATILFFVVQLALLAGLAFVSFRFSHPLLKNYLQLKDFDAAPYVATAAAASSVTLLARFLPITGCKRLSLTITATTVAFAAYAIRCNKTPLATGFFAALGAVTGALCFWLLLDWHWRSISAVLTQFYASWAMIGQGRRERAVGQT
ncbi:hypothetical protein AAVH_06733 [Aphelenchoides avenae]|nr:hypothetical protein AAVH_06733 [Aphelenchus avenae]